jgi:hypothetical protein
MKVYGHKALLTLINARTKRTDLSAGEDTSSPANAGEGGAGAPRSGGGREKRLGRVSPRVL